MCPSKELRYRNLMWMRSIRIQPQGMGRGQLLQSLALIAAILLLVHLYLHCQSVARLSCSGAGEATQATAHRREWMPPAATTTTPGSELSDNSTPPVAAQTFHDREPEFENRRRTLIRACKGHGAFEKLHQNNIERFSALLSICLNCKAGTTTFYYLQDQVKPAAPHRPVSATVVRHPLARLVSAYRDKFLNGEPLYIYTPDWQRNIQSSENWNVRFEEYWLPALVSQGFLPQTKEIIEKTGGSLNQLLSHNFTDVKERFMNTSFTFNQFLQHIVWTHDYDRVNPHWMTYHRHCDPCHWKFDYILKLETIEEDFEYLFHKVLGYGKTTQLPRRHVSHGRSDRQHYYTNVSRELMDRILDIYKYDFTIFGYDPDLW